MADFIAKVKAKVDTSGIAAEINKVASKQTIKIKADVSEVKAGLTAVRTETEKYSDSLGRTATVTRSYNKANEQVSGTMTTVTKKTQTATKATKSLGQEFTEIIGKVTKFGAATAVIGLFTTGVYKAWEVLKDFDSALTEFSKVSDYSQKSIGEYADKLGKLGESVYRSKTEMLEAATEFKKSGFTEEDSALLARTAALYQNIADEELSAAQASSVIISQLKAFNLTAQDSEHIIDAINEVSNIFAVSSGDIGKGLTAAGAALSTYGNSFEETIGLVSAGTEVFQGKSQQVARGLNTVASRIVKNEEALKQYGISIYDSNGALRSTYDILKDLAPVWETMSNAEQVALGNALSGVNQYKIFAAVLSNFDTAINATTTAITSLGSAEAENAKQANSYKAILNGLQAQFVELVTGEGGISSFIKLILKAGTSILKFANSDIGQLIIKLTALGIALKLLTNPVGTLYLNLSYASAQMLSMVAKAGTLKGAILSLSAAFKTLSLSSKVGLIGAGIGLVIGIVTSVTNKIKEARQATIDAGQAATDSAKNIKALYDNYAKLEKGLKDGTTSQDEFKTASDTLKTALTEQGINVDGLVTKYGDLSTALKTATTEQLEYAKVQAYDARVAAEKALKKGIMGMPSLPVGAYGKADLTTGAGIVEGYEILIKHKLDLYNAGKQETAGYKQISKGISILEPLVNAYNQALQNETDVIDMLNGKNVDLKDSITAIGDEFDETEDEAESLIETLDKLYNSVNSAGKAFKEFSDDGKLSYSTLSDIYIQFSDVSGIDDYINRLSDANLTSQELQQILGELTIAKAEDMLATQGVTEASQALISKMLEEAGVANSAEIAAYLVAAALETEGTSASNTKGALDDTKNSIINLGKAKFDASNVVSQLDWITNAASRAANGAAILQSVLAGEKGGFPYVPKVPPPPIIDWSSLIGGEGSKGRDGGATTPKDPIAEQSKLFKEQINILEHKLFLQKQISGTEGQQIVLQKEIQNALKTQAGWFRSKGVDENSEYLRDLQKQWWKYSDSIKDIYKDIAKARKEAYKDIAKARKEAYEAEKEELEKQQDNFGTAIDYYVSLIDKEIDNLETQKEAIEDRYDAEIDKLKEVNDELDSQIEREKLLENLAKAKSTQKLVYKDGKYQYVSDIARISEAQSALESFDREQKLKQEVKALEDARDAEVKAIDDQIKAWQDYQKEWKNIVDGYQREQNKLIAEQVLGISLEKANWDTRLTNAQEFVNRYNEIMSQIQEANEEIELTEAVISGAVISGDREYDIGGTQYIDTIKSQIQANSDAWHTASPQEKERLHAENIALGGLIGGEYTPESGKWAYANGTTSAQGGLSTVGEQGREMRVLNKGDGIIPHTLTENLMELGKFSPAQWLSKLGSTVNNASNTIINQFDKIVLPNVTDGNSFVRELKNFKQFAIQQGSSR